ncbi:MAG: extracellular solute-binding protein [Clostridiaceae bacterium]|jgi:putative aldouronate transport system substrate-binding protein|nr:extracellular solute-binding protein [Clostridiaceae bacterium]
MLKRKTSIILIAVLILAMIVTSCTGAKESGTQTGDTGTKTTDKDAAPKTGTSDSEEPYELTIFCADNNIADYPLDLENRPKLKLIKEMLKDKFNIELSLETAVGSRFVEVLNTRMASAANLPDIIVHRYDDVTLNNVYNNGLILDLTDLIKEHAPNIAKTYFEEDPYYIIANGTADGKILRVIQIVKNIQHTVTTLNVRYDWCKAVGMELPETTDQFYNMLKAFQEQDVNGNGMKDEIFMPDYVAMNQSLSTSFGVMKMNGASDSWFADSTGKIYHTMLTDEAKNYIAYVAKLYGEGLIDPDFLNQTQDQISEKRYANRMAGGVGAWWNSVLQSTALNAYAINAEFVSIPPLYNDEGTRHILKRNYAGGNCWMLTKDCRHPEAAIKMLDWFYTTDGSNYAYYGEIAPGGEYYVRDVAEAEKFGLQISPHVLTATDRFRQEQATEPDLRYKLGINTNVFPHKRVGRNDDIAWEFYNTYTEVVCGLAANIEYNMKVLNMFVNDIGVQDIGFVTPNSEQIKVIEETTDLFAYMDEMIQKFMTGVEPLSNWDNFVKQCESMGINKVRDVMQQRYDDYLRVMESYGFKVIKG